MLQEIIIGDIEWYGGYNHQKKKKNDFGFIINLINHKDEYINKNMFFLEEDKAILDDLFLETIVKYKELNKWKTFILTEKSFDKQTLEMKLKIIEIILYNNYFKIFNKFNCFEKLKKIFEIEKVEKIKLFLEFIIKYFSYDEILKIYSIFTDEEKEILFQEKIFLKSNFYYILQKKINFDNFNKNLTFDNLKKCIEVGDSIQNLAPNISMMLSDNTLKVNDIIELINGSEMVDGKKILLNLLSEEKLEEFLTNLIESDQISRIFSFKDHLLFFQVLNFIFTNQTFEKRFVVLKNLYGNIILKIEKILLNFDDKSLDEIINILNDSNLKFPEEIEFFVLSDLLTKFEIYLNNNNSSLLELIFKYFDGNIIFKNDISNKKYDDLRKKILENNFNGNLNLIENYLDIQVLGDTQESFLNSYYCYETGCYYNRLYFSSNFLDYYHANNKDREIVFSFKNGSSYIGQIYYIQSLISKMKINIYDTTIVNVPASNKIENKNRYFNFLRVLCVLTGLKNGFNVIYYLDSNAIIPKKMGGDGIIKNVGVNKLLTKKCIIFDDIVTSGSTIRTIENLLKNVGNITKIAFERTVSKYLKDGIAINIEVYGISNYYNEIKDSILTGINKEELDNKNIAEYCLTKEFKEHVTTLIPYYNRKWDHVNRYVINYSYLKDNSVIISSNFNLYLGNKFSLR